MFIKDEFGPAVNKSFLFYVIYAVVAEFPANTLGLLALVAVVGKNRILYVSFTVATV